MTNKPIIKINNLEWLSKPPQGDFVVLENFPHYKIYESGHVIKYKNVAAPKLIKPYYVDNYAVFKLYDKSRAEYRVIYLHKIIGEAFHDYDRYTSKLMYAPVNNEFPYHKDNFSVRPNSRSGFRGENNFNNKIDANKVLEIRASRAAGKTIVQLSQMFGLSKGQISMICNGKRWGWL